MRRSVSIIIPAYNEEKRLPATLLRIREYMAGSSWESSEIIVVDDGSRDKTSMIAKRSQIRLFRTDNN